MMQSYEALFEAAREKIARYHHDAEIIRQVPRLHRFWARAGLQMLKAVRRLEGWLIRHLPESEEGPGDDPQHWTLDT